MTKRLEVIGKRFTRLIVKEYHSTINRKLCYLCICDCGNEKIVSAGALNCGNTKSCGCLWIEAKGKTSLIHGLSHTSLHKNWCGMIGRCYNTNHISYKNYGGRGIKICKSWLTFVNFKNWAFKNGYAPDKSIERKNNDKSYSPTNCKWATRAEQSYNKRSNIKVIIDGVELNSKEVFEKYGIHPTMLSGRLKRGKTGLEAVKKPRRSGKKHRESI